MVGCNTTLIHIVNKYIYDLFAGKDEVGINGGCALKYGTIAYECGQIKRHCLTLSFMLLFLRCNDDNKTYKSAFFFFSLTEKKMYDKKTMLTEKEK